jgi:EAL domain-containing protein (putative c-di-GMP-specific phosphodiesterase class I)/GGDEF domain-containing protein
MAMVELQTLKSAISELSALADRLESRISFLENKLAIHSKSGLPSHYRMETELQEYFNLRNAEEVKTPFTLVIVQLEESWTSIRKTFPNSVNDWILFQIGARISEILQPGDRVFHTMDNEFILIVQKLRGAGLKHFLKMLFDVIEETHVFSGFNLKVSARGGAAFYPEHGTDRGQLLHHADLALGHGAHSRKRFQLFNRELLHEMVDKADLQNSILKGLESPLMEGLGQQFQMHFQPKLFLERTADRRYRVTAVAAEALIRWQHPVRGLVPPSSFIPLAEETGLILPLGKWTLFQVADHLEHWTSGLVGTAGISVNLSPRQFKSDGLLEVLAGLVAPGRSAAGRLTLELTETSVFEDPEHAVETMEQFKALGLKLSVDDFGTGYSSLSLLHRYPLDEIKIDRLFIEHIRDNAHDQSIVRSLVTLAREMGLTLIAEGVETVEVLDLLYETGCRGFQGWLIAPALTADEFERFCQDLESSDRLFDPANPGRFPRPNP